ncbi:MAG: right-handed parallel beta-helix repeat-containing protein [Clostridia bacterium]|nr:right-handed parallel beta-helix repeat-containing protein [Clostridia bacterium]
MNEISTAFDINKYGGIIRFGKEKVYDVYPEDSFNLTGYFCTNTAKKHENPDGARSVAIYLKDKKNMLIDGNGSTLLIHGKMTPFLFDGCENIVVRNLTVDYACPTMTEFTVLSNNNGVCDIRIHPDCRFRVDGNELYWCGENGADGKPYWEYKTYVQGRYVKVYDPETKMCRDFDRNDLKFEKIEQLDEHTLRVTLANKDADFKTGDIFQTRNIVRDQTGSLFNRSKNIVFEDMRIRFMHGLGMVSQFCENIAYRNCDFTPKEGRTIASTADFFQFSGCKGKITIENCKAYGAQDDYVNVHGTHLRIMEADEKENTVIVRFMHDETWGFQAFERGDELEFIKWNTLIPYEKTKVVSYKKLNDTDILLQLDRALPSIEVGRDVLENITWTPDLYVSNCDFGPTSGRGILCTTRGEVIIENNRFTNLWGPALLLEDDCNFWFESGKTNEIIFRNNVVTNCDYAGMWQGSPSIRYTPKVMDDNSTAFVHGKLTVTGNVFRQAAAGKHLFWLEYLGEAEISGNTFDAPYSIHTKVVGRITEQENLLMP